MQPNYQAPAELLNQRVIIVTGAGGGTGSGVAVACARHGAQVVLLGRTVKKLEAVYDTIEREHPGRAAILPIDFARGGLDHYLNLADTLTQEFGRIDGIVHSATELGVLTPLESYPPDQWDQVMRVNLYAPYLLTRVCLPLLKQSDQASVIFTTADVGRRGRAYWGAYGVTQFALEGMAQIWADELSANTSVRMNTLDPGRVATAWFGRAYPGADPAALPEPERLIQTYLYLLGKDSLGITGSAMSVQ